MFGKSPNLESRKQAVISHFKEILPEILGTHAPEAFRAIPPEKHAALLEKYKQDFAKIHEFIAAADEEQIVAYENNIRSGALKSSLSEPMREELHTLAVLHRIGEPLDALCKKTGVATTIRCSDYRPGAKNPINNRNMPITMTALEDGTHVLTVRPEVANLLTDDELLGSSVHEIAHSANGDLGPGKSGTTISHEVELLADAKAARLTGKNAQALASALVKLDGYAKTVYKANYEAKVDTLTEKWLGWLKKKSPKAHAEYVDYLKSPKVRQVAEKAGNVWLRLKPGGSYPSTALRVSELGKIEAHLAAEAVAWHPADVCTKSWINTIEKEAAAVAEEVLRHPPRL